VGEEVEDGGELEEVRLAARRVVEQDADVAAAGEVAELPASERIEGPGEGSGGGARRGGGVPEPVLANRRVRRDVELGRSGATAKLQGAHGRSFGQRDGADSGLSQVWIARSAASGFSSCFSSLWRVKSNFVLFALKRRKPVLHS